MPKKAKRTAARRKASAPRLATVRSLVRYAEERLAKAKLAFGQGTHAPVEEAIFLVYETLGLPVHRVDAHLSRKVTAAERERVLALVEARIRSRTPASITMGPLR